jgi:hypothetical protein
MKTPTTSATLRLSNANEEQFTKIILGDPALAELLEDLGYGPWRAACDDQDDSHLGTEENE